MSNRNDDESTTRTTTVTDRLSDMRDFCKMTQWWHNGSAMILNSFETFHSFLSGDLQITGFVYT